VHAPRRCHRPSAEEGGKKKGKKGGGKKRDHRHLLRILRPPVEGELNGAERATLPPLHETELERGGGEGKKERAMQTAHHRFPCKVMATSYLHHSLTSEGGKGGRGGRGKFSIPVLDIPRAMVVSVFSIMWNLSLLNLRGEKRKGGKNICVFAPSPTGIRENSAIPSSARSWSIHAEGKERKKKKGGRKKGEVSACHPLSTPAAQKTVSPH